MANSNTIVVTEQLSIEGVAYAPGDVIGTVEAGGKLVPTAAAAAQGVTPGHLVPRLRDKRVIIGDPRQFVATPEPEESGGDHDYDSLKQSEVLEEVNRRREAGRNIKPASMKKADLIAALVTDDKAAAAEKSES